MKLTEFKTIKNSDLLNEAGMFGNYGTAVLQNLKGTGGLSTVDRMAKNNFVNNFVARAYTNLESAINSGLVDVKLPISATPPSAPTATAPTATTAPQTPAQIRQAKQAGAAASARGQMAANVVAPKSATVTPQAQTQAQTPAQTPAQIRQAKQAVALPAVRSVSPTAPTRPTTPTSATAPTQMTARAGANTRAKLQQQRAAMRREGETFDKLNSIFESILEQAGPQSISSYIQKVFSQYMKGVNISDPHTQSLVKSLADEVQKTYSSGDKGKAALTKLADLGYSVNYSSKGEEAEMTPTTATAAKTQAPTGTSAPARNVNVPALIAQINLLSNQDKQKLIQKIQTSMTSAATEEEPVTISGQKILPSDPMYQKIMQARAK